MNKTNWKTVLLIMMLNAFCFRLLLISFAGVIGCCIMLFLLTILLEGGKSLILYIQLRLKQNPLTYGRNATSETSINHDRSAIFSALLIPTSVAQIKKERSVRWGVVLLRCAVPLLFSPCTNFGFCF